MLTVKCQGCGAVYKLAEDLYSRKAAGFGVVVTCRRCKTEIHVEAPSGASSHTTNASAETQTAPAADAPMPETYDGEVIAALATTGSHRKRRRRTLGCKRHRRTTPRTRRPLRHSPPRSPRMWPPRCRRAPRPKRRRAGPTSWRRHPPLRRRSPSSHLSRRRASKDLVSPKHRSLPPQRRLRPSPPLPLTHRKRLRAANRPLQRAWDRPAISRVRRPARRHRNSSPKRTPWRARSSRFRPGCSMRRDPNLSPIRKLPSIRAISSTNRKRACRRKRPRYGGRPCPTNPLLRTTRGRTPSQAEGAAEAAETETPRPGAVGRRLRRSPGRRCELRGSSGPRSRGATPRRAGLLRSRRSPARIGETARKSEGFPDEPHARSERRRAATLGQVVAHRSHRPRRARRRRDLRFRVSKPASRQRSSAGCRETRGQRHSRRRASHCPAAHDSGAQPCRGGTRCTAGVSSSHGHGDTEERANRCSKRCRSPKRRRRVTASVDARPCNHGACFRHARALGTHRAPKRKDRSTPTRRAPRSPAPSLKPRAAASRAIRAAWLP